MTDISVSDSDVPRPVEGAHRPRPVLTLDVALYEQYLADSELCAADKRALLETLWSIIVGFVDLGFGIHPLQQACGEIPEIYPNLAAESPKMLHSSHQKSKTSFRKAAGHHADDRAG